MIKTKDSFRVSKATARRNNVTVRFCPYRPAASVECISEDERQCKGCGWHPIVEANRIAALRELFKLCP